MHWRVVKKGGGGGGGGGGVLRVSGIRTCIARGSSGSTATLNINKLNLLDYNAGTERRDAAAASRRWERVPRAKGAYRKGKNAER